MIFKVIGDVHPDSHYLGYVKHHPDGKGDRRLFGKTYRQNSVVSKSFRGSGPTRPECYAAHSEVLGCVITGSRPTRTLSLITHAAKRWQPSTTPARIDVEAARAGPDLRTIIEHIVGSGSADLFGVTGSFLVGCFTARSDIYLVRHGKAGYETARELFRDSQLVKPYAGEDLMWSLSPPGEVHVG